MEKVSGRIRLRCRFLPIIEFDERRCSNGIRRGRIVGEETASCRSQVGIDVKRMSICTSQRELSVGKHTPHELVVVELGFFIGEEVIQIDIELVLKVLYVAM